MLITIKLFFLPNVHVSVVIKDSADEETIQIVQSIWDRVSFLATFCGSAYIACIRIIASEYKKTIEDLL